MKIYVAGDDDVTLETPTSFEVEEILRSSAWKSATRNKYLKLNINRTNIYDMFLIRPKDGQFKDEPEILLKEWDSDNMQMGYYIFKEYGPYLIKNGIEYSVSMIICS
jgi:hypothetical protein